MGNTSSNNRRHQGHHHNHTHPLPPAPQSQIPPQPHITTNQYVFAPPTHYPNPNPSPYYNQQTPGYYSEWPRRFSPTPLPIPHHNYHRYPCVAPPHPLVPYVEHQKAITIRNDVNVKKESIRVFEDEENPGKFLATFTFDATVSGSIAVAFFAKEDVDGNLIATKESVPKPVIVPFEQGLSQKFRQPSGTGIDFALLEETELTKENDEGVYPLVVKAEVHSSNNDGSEANSSGNSQVTLAVFDKKEKGEYLVRVMKQILWANGTRYELQEIYGIVNSVEVGSDGNDSGKECVICMSEPRDTTVLPCRHMCMCNGCAKVLQLQTNRCPICRQPVERLLEIEVKDGTDS